MRFKNNYIITNTREQFQNESKLSSTPYSDHPSQASVDFIISELYKVGFEACFYGGVESLIEACEKKMTFKDTLFLNFSDGLSHKSRKAQSAILLELLGVPYAGSEPLARLMAGNKAYTKRIVSEWLNTPRGITVFKKSAIPPNIEFPVIVKPNREGSSMGITQESICKSKQDLHRQLPSLLERFQEVLIEEYIEGYEITCFIIGNKGRYFLTEPIVCEYNGIRYFKDFVFGLEEKANRTRKEYLAQNFLKSSEIEMIRRATQTAFEALGMNDFARADFRLRKDGCLFFIEINGNAVISETSELGIISKELGIPFGKIVGDIILSATERFSIIHG